MTGDDILNRIKTAENLESNLSNKFGLRYNPFPRSGIANIDDPDEITRALVPAYSKLQLRLLIICVMHYLKVVDKIRMINI